jgi:aquaporin Z
MKKYLVEFIGMFLFVLVVGMVVIDPGAGSFAPIAIGATLMILVYAGGHVSGGHYNPAVTLAVWLRGRCATADVVPYWISQILGALIASQVVLYLKIDPTVVTPHIVPPHELNTVPALIAEFIGTFALCYVVLNVATAKATAGNSFYGLAIGFTVVVMAFALGGISGGAFNPAIATGITVMHIEKAANFWIYLVGDFAAAALAAITFKFINPEDK